MLSDFDISNGSVQLSYRNMYKMLNCKHCRSHQLQLCSHYTCLWNIIFEDVKILYFMIESFWKLLRTLGVSTCVMNLARRISRIFLLSTISQENTVIALAIHLELHVGLRVQRHFCLHFKQTLTFLTLTLQYFMTIRSESAEMFHVEAQMWCS